ncbi:MAG: hypothetical protein CMQ41_14020 [Gammaproteobacteria bacterium]|nr:hypothetical protein [Gammaproteobacteria bacterium]
MQEPGWTNDPLSILIGAISQEEFFAAYYEQKALLHDHNNPEQFADLLSITRVDDIIASSELPPASLDMARKEPPIKRSYFTFKNGNIDRGAVIRHYQQGATIILNQLHLADKKLATFVRALENVFSTHVQTNVYLTPPNSQGFSTHYDDHDVFILQIKGEKIWRLYRKPIDNPYRGESFKSGEYEVGDIEKEFILKAGDCIYIPRGMMHDAESHGEDPSLHITVGLLVKKWADLMLEAMSEVALRHPKFRRSIPPGFARENFDKQKAAKVFTELVEEFKTEANFEEVFTFFKESFIRFRGPDVSGSLVEASKAMEPSDKYVRRTNSQVLLRCSDKESIIICGGGNIHFGLEAYSGLETAMSGESFTMADFKGIELEEAEDIIRKLNAFGLVKKIKE